MSSRRAVSGFKFVFLLCIAMDGCCSTRLYNACSFLGEDSPSVPFPRRDMDYDVAEMDSDGGTRLGSKLLICMIGLSGCGKTYYLVYFRNW